MGQMNKQCVCVAVYCVVHIYLIYQSPIARHFEYPLDKENRWESVVEANGSIQIILTVTSTLAAVIMADGKRGVYVVHKELVVDWLEEKVDGIHDRYV